MTDPSAPVLASLAERIDLALIAAKRLQETAVGADAVLASRMVRELVGMSSTVRSRVARGR